MNFHEALSHRINEILSTKGRTYLTSKTGTTKKLATNFSSNLFAQKSLSKYLPTVFLSISSAIAIRNDRLQFRATSLKV